MIIGDPISTGVVEGAISVILDPNDGMVVVHRATVQLKTGNRISLVGSTGKIVILQGAADANLPI